MIYQPSLITSSATWIAQQELSDEPRKKQLRVIHEEIPVQDIDPDLRDLGCHIAHCAHKHVRVRVPAMCGSQWSHFLRSLETSRALS